MNKLQFNTTRSVLEQTLLGSIVDLAKAERAKNLAEGDAARKAAHEALVQARKPVRTNVDMLVNWLLREEDVTEDDKPVDNIG